MHENEKTLRTAAAVLTSLFFMPTQKLPNYLRTHRKRMGLSQADVAYLLGVRSGTKLSRYERFRRMPSLGTAFAFAVIYDTPVDELFAGLMDDAARMTLKRARLRVRRLAARRKDPHVLRKLTALRAVIAAKVEDVSYAPLPRR